MSDMHTTTEIVTAEMLTTYRLRVKRAGGVITCSAPVGKGYAVTVSYR